MSIGNIEHPQLIVEIKDTDGLLYERFECRENVVIGLPDYTTLVQLARAVRDQIEWKFECDD